MSHGQKRIVLTVMFIVDRTSKALYPVGSIGSWKERKEAFKIWHRAFSEYLNQSRIGAMRPNVRIVYVTCGFGARATNWDLSTSNLIAAGTYVRILSSAIKSLPTSSYLVALAPSDPPF